MYLLDTNVISEYRKRGNANWGVRDFFMKADPEALFLPVQVLGEIRAGIAKLRRRVGDAKAQEKAEIYERWLEDDLLENYSSRLIDFELNSSVIWGQLLSGEKKDPHTIDKQIAAMALTRDMTVVSRDTGNSFTAVPNLKLLNPFQEGPAPPGWPDRSYFTLNS